MRMAPSAEPATYRFEVHLHVSLALTLRSRICPLSSKSRSRTCSLPVRSMFRTEILPCFRLDCFFFERTAGSCIRQWTGSLPRKVQKLEWVLEHIWDKQYVSKNVCLFWSLINMRLNKLSGLPPELIQKYSEAAGSHTKKYISWKSSAQALFQLHVYMLSE